jgi:hypothetical protein
LILNHFKVKRAGYFNKLNVRNREMSQKKMMRMRMICQSLLI